MQKKRWLYGGLSVLIVLCLTLGTGAFVFYKRIPSVANQLASHDETTVLIISPDGSASYPADASIPITAMATSSQPMTAMELWVDGSLFATQSPRTDENASLFYKNWHWMPLIPGEHLLVVRAINQDGSVGTSNLVRIKTDKAAGFILRHTTQPGDTWESLTQSCDTSVETIAGQNPGFDPAAPLPVGKQVQIPCGSLLPPMAYTGPGITPPLTEQPASSPGSPPGNVGFWLNSLFSPTSVLPSAPSLTAGLNGCTVTLLVQDNSKDEKGFEIWRSGVNGYDLIATLGPNSGASFSYKETVQQPGQLQYVVSAINTKGKMASNIVAVNVPDGACGDPGNPDVSYANGILT
ncbi:MAG TPA: LysM domain-containing protein, partial [Anaerolineales bacterium]